MTHGPIEHHPDQQYRYLRIEHENAVILDHRYLWHTDHQLSQLPPTQQATIKHTRDQALWLTLEHLFNGTHPTTPRAQRIIADWTGPQGSQP